MTKTFAYSTVNVSEAVGFLSDFYLDGYMRKVFRADGNIWKLPKKNKYFHGKRIRNFKWYIHLKNKIQTLWRLFSAPLQWQYRWNSFISWRFLMENVSWICWRALCWLFPSSSSSSLARMCCPLTGSNSLWISWNEENIHFYRRIALSLYFCRLSSVSKMGIKIIFYSGGS